jgi:hypothetical protein
MEDSSAVEKPREAPLQLNLSRVLVLSIVSTGLYLLFWSYYTWKQLQLETGERHYPVWHALTLFVPVYSLFRLHRHFSIINDLAVKANTSSLGPVAGVTLVLLSSVLAYVSIGVSDTAAKIVLLVISTASITTAVYFAQEGLNSVWRRRNPYGISTQRLHWAEITVSALGLLTWIGALFPAPSA